MMIMSGCEANNMVYFASKFLYIQKIFGGANSFFVY